MSINLTFFHFPLTLVSAHILIDSKWILIVLNHLNQYFRSSQRTFKFDWILNILGCAVELCIFVATCLLFYEDKPFRKLPKFNFITSQTWDFVPKGLNLNQIRTMGTILGKLETMRLCFVWVGTIFRCFLGQNGINFLRDTAIEINN